MTHSETTSGPTPGTHGWTVRGHLALIFVTAVVLAAGALGYGYAWSADRAEQDAAARLRAQAQAAANAVADDLSDAVAQVEALVEDDLVALMGSPATCPLVLGRSESFATTRLDVVTRDGRIVCSSQPGAVDADAVPHRGATWLGRTLSTEHTTVLWPTVDPLTGQRAVVVAHALAPDGGVRGAGAPPAGAVALVLDSRSVAPVLANQQELPRDGGLVLVDRVTHEVVASSDRGIAAPYEVPLRWGPPGRYPGVDGEPRVVASADVAVVPWRFYAARELATVTAAARGTLTRQAVTAAVALLALALAVVLLERRVAGPLAELTRVVVRARDGAGTARAPEKGTAEIAALARAFNSMLDIRAGQEARLAYGASHDALTGLPNTSGFRVRVDAALAAEPRPEVTVLCVGLDRFGAIRDGIGTEGAERVLVEVAQRLRDTVRSGDTVARGEGERFFVAGTDLTAQDATELAERIHAVVEEPMRWPTGDVVVGASTGVAVAAPGAVAEDVVRRSLTAMGDAQARGRPWSVFDDSMHRLAVHQLQTEKGLRDALARDELVVHYQPIVETDSGRLVGAEALVRWQHPERGMVGPMDFIGVAERTGQIHAIGRHVLRKACEQAVRWAPADGPFSMSVNVAAAQLLDEGFTDVVAGVLAETGLAPGRLCLEVTESAVIRRAGSGADTLHRLRALGVQVAVDDFGTGYSSLAYLKNLPITLLKIDRSFITRIEHDQRDRHLVEAVLGMARALGLAVVAEGVETPGQRLLLEGLGCPSAQGYLFGRPCPTDDFAALVDERSASALP